MITLVGVGHVFAVRRGVRRIIVERRPLVVAVELDRLRFEALQRRHRRGRAPLTYRLLAFIQERIAREYGADVGEEMLAAAYAAREVGAHLAFIDMDSTIVFRRMMREMGLTERIRLFLASLGGLFVRRRKVEAELARYEADSQAYLREFAREFPRIKRVLIDERDRHMAAALRDLETRYERVVAVVGDGHVEGLLRLLADRGLETIRLRELRREGAPSDAATATVPP
jgi:pheromone shutdown protein TraB